MIRDAVAHEGMFNVVHLDTGIKVDVYVLKTDSWSQTAFTRKRPDNVAEGARGFVFGSAEDILLHKLFWFRQGGEQWKDILGILRVQTSLDRAYLDRWAPSLGVEDLVARARREVGSL